MKGTLIRSRGNKTLLQIREKIPGGFNCTVVRSGKKVFVSFGDAQSIRSLRKKS